MTTKTRRIVVAGATGNMGGRIVRNLHARGAQPIALVRRGTDPQRLKPLQELSVPIVQADLRIVAEVAEACADASCVVSALLGLEDVMVGMQSTVLQGAIAADVPRFIPSDYSMDFTKVQPGSNRNLDLHREFQQIADRAPIAVTSILNGAFMELLTGEAPFLLFKLHRALYWENADQPLDFTTMDNTAAFTAAAAMDAATPRWLSIVGEQITARQLAATASELTGREWKLFRAGPLSRLATIIKIARTLQPARDKPFPVWQGMQYMRNMFAGEGRLAPADNQRYPDVGWTSVREVLAAHLSDARA